MNDDKGDEGEEEGKSEEKQVYTNLEVVEVQEQYGGVMILAP